MVVGLGYGGLGAAKTLAGQLPPTQRVVVIHESEFAYNPVASLRAATVPGWENKIMVPVGGILEPIHDMSC